MRLTKEIETTEIDCGHGVSLCASMSLGPWLRCDRCGVKLPDPSIHIIYYVTNSAGQEVKAVTAAFDHNAFDDMLCEACFRALTRREVAARLIAAMVVGRTYA